MVCVLWFPPLEGEGEGEGRQTLPCSGSQPGNRKQGAHVPYKDLDTFIPAMLIHTCTGTHDLAQQGCAVHLKLRYNLLVDLLW